MAARGDGTHGVSKRGRGGRRWLGCTLAAVLALAGCSSGSPTPSASPPGGSPSPAPTSPAPGSSSPGTGSTGWPDKAFTDAELVAVINGVGQSRNLPFPAAQDSERQRSGASSGAFPQVSSETAPPECAVFVPQNPFVRWADKTASFAEGIMPIGTPSGPTTTIMVTLRSAEKDAIAKADFGYTDDLVSTCQQFDASSTESGRTTTYAVQLLAVPPIAEKQHGYMQSTKPKGPGDYGMVGLRVLAGTMSISLSLSVATLDSESDAKPALDSMAGLAKELIDQAVKRPPTVAPAAENSRTPDDLVALVSGVPGPNGNPVTLPGASVIGPVPGFTGGPAPQESAAPAPCTFGDTAYFGSLTGAVLGQGQIQGASKMEYTDFSVISMPTAAAPPYPFDSRATELRECQSIQEELMGGSPRPWTALSRLNAALTADSSYAVAYQLADGTGEWHVRAGARRGTLSVEASSTISSEAETQATADRLMAFFGRVFANAGV